MPAVESDWMQTASETGLVAVDGRTFPLREAAIRARAEGGLAQTTFIQSYVNPYQQPLEVLYTLPLPADGSVVGYTITLGDTIITGHIEPREQARESYLKAIEEGKAAGLLEQERPDTFTQRLGSLPPGADVRVEIQVLHPLAFLATTSHNVAQWVYRFPTVVGVRYEGAPGRVADADRLDVDRADSGGTPVRLALDLHLADGEPVGIAPESPSHALRVEMDAGGSRIGLSEPAPLDRDVVVRWNASSSHIGLRMITGGGLAGDDGRYGLLTITPPMQPETTFVRDLTLLIDASGSMSGKPIERAKELAGRLLMSLVANDRFEVLAFANQPQTLVRGPKPATESNVRDALDQLARLQAGGGTEMADAIEHALKPLRPGSQRQVVLLTDGYIGFEGEVIAKVLHGLPEGARLHVVGIGRAPNRSLTRCAARAGRGVELIVDESKVTEATAERLLQATVAPILTDIVIGGRGVRGVAPKRPCDVLAGQPLVVAVELEPTDGTVEVTGRLAGQGERWSACIETMATGEGGESCVPSALPIGALFGREAIEDQELLIAADDDEAAGITLRIEALGLRHQITSRRTSLVAIAENPTVNPTDPRRRQRLAVEVPADMSAGGLGMRTLSLKSTRVLSRLTTADDLARLSFGIDEADELREAMEWAVRTTSRRKSLVSIEDHAAMADIMPEFKLTARMLRVDKDLVVIEFETPHAGFRFPAGDREVQVIYMHDKTTVAAKMDPSLSTHPGPHERALTFRLALRTRDGAAWPSGVARLVWNLLPIIEFSVP